MTYCRREEEDQSEGACVKVVCVMGYDDRVCHNTDHRVCMNLSNAIGNARHKDDDR